LCEIDKNIYKAPNISGRTREVNLKKQKEKKLKRISERYFNTSGCPFCHQKELFLVRGGNAEGIEYSCGKCSARFVVVHTLTAIVPVEELFRRLKKSRKKK
jgi:transcription elongation factor Elf1